MRKSKVKPPINAKDLLKDFCREWADLFDCPSEYGCEATCPLRAFVECRHVQQLDGGTMHKATRNYIRKHIGQIEAIKIIENKFGLTFEQIKNIIKFRDQEE
jgi:hypothetical protein